MPIYSHSRLGSFENCRLSYKFHYIDKIRGGKEGVEAFLGSRFHDTMEKLYAELKFKIATLDELKTFYNEEWAKNWNDDIIIVRTDRTQEDYKNIGLKCIEDYYKRHHPFEEGRVLGVEKRVVVDLDDVGKYRVQGFIDRLMETEDGHYEIHDYKTSNSIPDQAHLDSDRQLALYEMAVRQTWPKDVQVVDLVWHYVTFDKEMRSTRTRAELDELRQNTIALIDTVEAAEDYPPNESALCRWCDYQDICPLFAHKFKTDTLPANEYLKEEGVTLVNKYASLDAKKKELKTEIKQIDVEQDKIAEAAIARAAAEKVDRLYGSDKVLNIKDDIEVEYPKSGDDLRQQFEEQIDSAGLRDDLFDLSSYTIRKLAKDNKWYQNLPAKLKEFIKVETFKKVSLSKRKDEE
ncbi:PD-(D/E)XK nuclease family protein [bacterium]|nr:PD-(D/E)XK nuclease family protein [bacterium]